MYRPRNGNSGVSFVQRHSFKFLALGLSVVNLIETKELKNIDTACALYFILNIHYILNTFHPSFILSLSRKRLIIIDFFKQNIKY